MSTFDPCWYIDDYMRNVDWRKWSANKLIKAPMSSGGIIVGRTTFNHAYVFDISDNHLSLNMFRMKL